MPTVFQEGSYDLVFFSSDGGEPADIHAKRDRLIAKFWLDPVSLSKNRGFSEHELNQIARLVTNYPQELLEAWRDYFSP
jgi:hypothetical protein